MIDHIERMRRLLPVGSFTTNSFEHNINPETVTILSNGCELLSTSPVLSGTKFKEGPYGTASFDSDNVALYKGSMGFGMISKTDAEIVRHYYLMLENAANTFQSIFTKEELDKCEINFQSVEISQEYPLFIVFLKLKRKA